MSPEILLRGIRWYVASPLRTRQVAARREERGVEVAYLIGGAPPHQHGGRLGPADLASPRPAALGDEQAVQEERFLNRLNNPTKRWKLSSVDLKARGLYDDYTEARELMLSATHTDYAPWTLVDFNDQPRGRLTLLRDLLDRVPDTELPLADIPWPPLNAAPRKERYGVLEPIPSYRAPPARRRAQAL